MASSEAAAGGGGGGGRKEATSSTSSLSSLLPSKPSSSRYDFIKVRVHSGPHYHVLSRYLLARRLSFTLLPSSLCVHLALLIKKRCVDDGLLDLERSSLESMIEEAITAALPSVQQRLLVLDRWRLVRRFTERRIPLLILLTGTAGVAKSVVARKLANRLNIPTVLQTATTYRLACSLDPSLPSRPLHRQRFDSAAALAAAQLQRCRVVRSALQHDLMKCLNEGRPLMVEGTDLALALYEGGEEWRGADAPVVLAFVLKADTTERRLMMQGDMCREAEMRLEAEAEAGSDSGSEEPPLAPSEVEENVLRLQQWMEDMAEEQRRRWRAMKEAQLPVDGDVDAEAGKRGAGIASPPVLPLVPQVVPHRAARQLVGSGQHAQRSARLHQSVVSIEPWRQRDRATTSTG